MRAPGGRPKSATASRATAALASTALACTTAPRLKAETPAPSAAPRHTAAPWTADFDLTWHGHPVGEAREELTERPGAAGYRLARREHWRVSRGGQPVDWEIEVIIDTDRDLRGEQVALYRDRVLLGSARRRQSDWLVEPAPGRGANRRAPARAEPAELILRQLARTQRTHWKGPVLLAGFDFAQADLTVETTDPRHRQVTLTAPAGELPVQIELRPDGTIESIEGPDLSQKRRPAPPRPQAAIDRIDPPDLIELGTIVITSRAPRRRSEHRAPAILVLDLPAGRERALPAVFPGQRIRREGRAWWIELGPTATPVDPPWPEPAIPDPPPGPALRARADEIAREAHASDPRTELRALTSATNRSLTDDLATEPLTTADDAAARSRGDCVSHAALFSALARARGFDIRLVTGYRIDETRPTRRLVRHVWAIARLNGKAIPIDPTFGEAPAPPGRHIALAIHGSAPGEIALAAELAFAGLTGAQAHRPQEHRDQEATNASP